MTIHIKFNNQNCYTMCKYEKKLFILNAHTLGGKNITSKNKGRRHVLMNMRPLVRVWRDGFCMLNKDKWLKPKSFIIIVTCDLFSLMVRGLCVGVTEKGNLRFGRIQTVGSKPGTRNSSDHIWNLSL